MKADIYARRYEVIKSNAGETGAIEWLVETLVEEIIRKMTSREREDLSKFVDHMIAQKDMTWKAIARRVNIPVTLFDRFPDLAIQFLTKNSMEVENGQTQTTV